MTVAERSCTCSPSRGWDVRGIVTSVSNFWTRTISRWVTVGLIGLGIFGVRFLIEFARGDSRGSLWLYGLLAAFSLGVLCFGLYRTRRMWATDSTT